MHLDVLFVLLNTWHLLPVQDEVKYSHLSIYSAMGTSPVPFRRQCQIKKVQQLLQKPLRDLSIG